ncbi:MAG: biopolymer transporter ExbD [Marivibrio sp.]|uniref:ExbD/TolR family protein n=1 Tax=Marivibrio sp. TaxID=2039719 RepID=UPI0032EBF33D
MIGARRAGAAGRSSLGLVGDLTPLIDVLFMLIVFMVLTANAAERALDAGFASSEESLAAPSAGDRPLAVEIGAADAPAAFRIEDRAYADWPAAKTALAAQLQEGAGAAPSLRVAVAADAPAQRMIDLMSFLQVRGVTDAQIVVRSR